MREGQGQETKPAIGAQKLEQEVLVWILTMKPQYAGSNFEPPRFLEFVRPQFLGWDVFRQGVGLQ